MEPQTERWLALSEYDMGVAELLYQQEVYRYAVFFCQLGLEKLLKAILLERSGRNEPPRTHNLASLVERAGLYLPGEHLVFLEIISHLATDTRYPENDSLYTRGFCERMMSGSQEVHQWLKSSYL